MQRSDLWRNVARGAVALLVGAVGSGTVVAQPDSVARANLNDSVMTAVGPRRAIELPIGVAQFNVASVMGQLPVANLSQLLSGRFAAVQVLSPGATGTASRIRIRGQSSLRLSNDPLFIVDGVRLVRQRSVTTRTVPSRVDDINVNEIEKVEIIGGAAGASLYGSEASNGVVNITNKGGGAVFDDEKVDVNYLFLWWL